MKIECDRKCACVHIMHEDTWRSSRQEIIKFVRSQTEMFHNFSYNFQIPDFMTIPSACLALYAYIQTGRRTDSTNRKERNKRPIWAATGVCDLDSLTLVTAAIKTVMDFVLYVRRRTSWLQSQLKWRMDDVYQEPTKCIYVRRTKKMHLHLVNLFLKFSSTCFEQTFSS